MTIKRMFLFSLISVPPLCAQEECPLQPQVIQCCELTYPSCRFDTNCGYGFYFTGEGLWWIAKENGLIFAQEGVPSPGPRTDGIPPKSLNFNGKIKRIQPEWDWGFRLGLGYNFCYDEWDGKISWTSYKTAKTDKTSENSLNLWAHTDVKSSNTSLLIDAKWNFDYNTLDFELARAFGAGRCFCLRPYFGIRVAWIDQELKIFNKVLLPHPHPGETLSTNLNALSDFMGAGFRFGLDGRFDFCWNFSLFGLGSYSLLYGRFDADFHEFASGSGHGVTVSKLLIADADDEFNMGISSLQLSLGLQWNRSFCCGRYRFGLHLAWEQNMWFQLNQMNHFLHQLNEGLLFQENGNLSLQGLSFGARIDF